MLVVWVMGPQSQKDLASFANVTAATISSVLNTLDDEGLIVRTRNSTDRRIVNIELTAAGEKAVSELYRLHLQREAQWLAGLSEKMKQQLVMISRQILRTRPPYSKE
nr:MarR family transcriptional regulator [Nocardioides ginsengisegetis]